MNYKTRRGWVTLLDDSEEPFVRKLNSLRVLTTFVGIWLRYCLKPWRLLMEMEPRFSCLLYVRICCRCHCHVGGGEGERELGVGTQWHKAKQEESRCKKTK